MKRLAAGTTLAIAVVTLLAAPAAAWATGGGASGETGVTVRLDTFLESEGPPLVDMRVKLPLTAGNARRLEAVRASRASFSPSYRKALEQVLVQSDALAAEDAEIVLDDAHQLPTMRISPKAATLALGDVPRLLWSESEGNRVLSLKPMEVPEGTRLDVRLHTQPGEDPITATPLPREDDGSDDLGWRFEGERLAEVQVRLAGPVEDSWQAAIAKGALAFLLEGLPFLLAIGLFSLPRRKGIRPRIRPVRVALAGLAVTLGCVGYFVCAYIAGPGSNTDMTRFANTFVPGLGLAAFVALSLRRRRIAAFVATLAGVAVLAFLAAHRLSLDTCPRSTASR